MKMQNETYDRLKWIAQIFLPALASLVVAVCELWDAGNGALIGGTIMAIDTFLGACLQVSTNNYWKEQK